MERGEGGAIVNMSSISGLRAGNKNTLYCSAKVGLDMLTRTMALELGPHQVHIIYEPEHDKSYKITCEDSDQPTQRSRGSWLK